MPSLKTFLARLYANSSKVERQAKRSQAITSSTLKVWCEQMNQSDFGGGIRIQGQGSSHLSNSWQAAFVVVAKICSKAWLRQYLLNNQASPRAKIHSSAAVSAAEEGSKIIFAESNLSLGIQKTNEALKSGNSSGQFIGKQCSWSFLYFVVS